MQRVDLYLKVELELDDKDVPDRVAREICRQLLKTYAVRNAEVSSLVDKD